MSGATEFKPLGGITVIEVAGGLPAAYATKLFADAGATVVRLEEAEADELRRWSWSGSTGQDGHPDGALYRHLQEGKDVVRLDRHDGRGRLVELIRSANLIVREQPRRPRPLLEAALDQAAGRGDSSRSMVTISAFGSSGPLADRWANEFLLQARMGSIFVHGLPDRLPIPVGGRLGEWVTGVFAAVGGLSACIQADRTGLGSELDVSMLECLALTLVTYPTVAASFPGGYRSRGVGMMIPAVEPCADGYVGMFTVTAEQFAAFLTMIERPDLAADPELATYEGRFPRMQELVEATHSWTKARTVEEVIQQAVLFRVPAAPIGNGQTLPAMEQTKVRGVFSRSPDGVLRPRPPFRWHLPEGEGEPGSSELLGPRDPDSDFFPLVGTRILDLTAFWAGPFATLYLASMGADVLKLESVQRPDPIRYNTRTPPTEPLWYEQGYLFQGANLGKRDVTLNLQDPVGRELALRLLATCDVVVENFTPRVLDQFDLGFDTLRRARPDLICVRMPAFGLDGPWRDRPGFAPNVEQASGLAWVTGYPDSPPMIPGGSFDPIAGMYAAFAVMGALRHGARQPCPQLVELPMIEIGAALAAEQVIEWDAYHHLVSRDGSRDPRRAPQGVYACQGTEAWVAVSVTDDREWRALGDLLGVTDEERFAEAAGRLVHHDELDELLSAWSATRTPEEACRELDAAGVPCAVVVAAYDIDRDPQMVARGFWEEIEHPVVGRHRFPSWPFCTQARRAPWHLAPAPLLGQDSDEILGDALGLTPGELEALRARQVIGTIPAGL